VVRDKKIVKKNAAKRATSKVRRKKTKEKVGRVENGKKGEKRKMNGPGTFISKLRNFLRKRQKERRREVQNRREPLKRGRKKKSSLVSQRRGRLGLKEPGRELPHV